jgi:selenocysteine lyase/cysteine desulfurase
MLFELEPPETEEIERLVRETARKVHQQTPIEVALTRGDLDAIVRNLRGLQRREIERVIVELVTDDAKLDPDDLPRLISKKRELVQSGGMLEYVDAPASLG